MSGYRTHLAGALVALVLTLLAAGFWWQLSEREIGACLLIAVLAALWPDVDTKSFGQVLFYSMFFLFDLGLIYHGLYKESAYFGLFIMLPILGKHRGFTHTVWAAVLIPGLLYGVYVFYQGQFTPRTVVYLGAGLLGYFSHLALDRKPIF